MIVAAHIDCVTIAIHLRNIALRLPGTLKKYKIGKKKLCLVSTQILGSVLGTFGEKLALFTPNFLVTLKKIGLYLDSASDEF